MVIKLFKFIREPWKLNITAAICIASSQLTSNKTVNLDTLYSSTVQSF